MMKKQWVDGDHRNPLSPFQNQLHNPKGKSVQGKRGGNMRRSAESAYTLSSSSSSSSSILSFSFSRSQIASETQLDNEGIALRWWSERYRVASEFSSCRLKSWSAVCAQRARRDAASERDNNPFLILWQTKTIRSDPILSFVTYSKKGQGKFYFPLRFIFYCGASAKAGAKMVSRTFFL